jgi:hypothetical protein
MHARVVPVRADTSTRDLQGRRRKIGKAETKAMAGEVKSVLPFKQHDTREQEPDPRSLSVPMRHDELSLL